jgi:hypothetical protein
LTSGEKQKEPAPASTSISLNVKALAQMALALDDVDAQLASAFFAVDRQASGCRPGVDPYDTGAAVRAAEEARPLWEDYTRKALTAQGFPPPFSLLLMLISSLKRKY